MDPSCSLVGSASISPAHPGPDDTISYRIPLAATLVDAGAIVVANALVDESTRSIYLDAVIATPGQRLPVGRTVHDPQLDEFGTFGPLQPGIYSLYTGVHRLGDGGDTAQPVCDEATPASSLSRLVVGESPAPVAVAPVVEYYDAARDHYFVTQDPAEISALDGGPHSGWVHTGQTFNAYVPGQSDGRGRPAARYYGLPFAGLDTHFLTIRSEDPGPSWLLESADAFEVAQPDTLTGQCPSDATVPVYRLWNRRADSNHRYTTDAAIRQQMIARGWVAEGYGADGVMLCAPAR